MNIITEVTKNGRIQDGIATILKLDDETFEKVIERISKRILCKWFTSFSSRVIFNV